MRIIEIESCGSTNSWASENLAPEPGLPVMVYARKQTAGRGQRGNFWEAEPEMNLTASMACVPCGIRPDAQFLISEAVALAVVDLLDTLDIHAMVKWPNDIYVADKKICGILIENVVMASAIQRSIAGIGLNVNQTLFQSDAPNPVSVKMITGRENPVEEIAGMLAFALDARLRSITNASQEAFDKIHREFKNRLWRGDGALWPFRDKLTGEDISASILDVAPDGRLSLRLSDSSIRGYWFKEVEFVLPHL